MPRPITRALMTAATALGLAVAGCANPADDKFMVTAEPPKPVETATAEPAPAAAAHAADSADAANPADAATAAPVAGSRLGEGAEALDVELHVEQQQG